MTEILVAFLGALGLVVPALLAIPLGPRRRLARIQAEAATLDALPEEASEAKRDLVIQIESAVGSYRHASRYGTIVSNSIMSISGLAMVVLGVALVRDPEPDALLRRALTFGASLALAWGVVLIILSGVNNYFGYRDYKRQYERAKKDLEESNKVMEHLQPLAEPAKEVKQELKDEGYRIATLEGRQELLTLRLRRVELEKALRSLEEAAQDVLEAKAEIGEREN